jgi:hypothetical protein
MTSLLAKTHARPKTGRRAIRQLVAVAAPVAVHRLSTLTQHLLQLKLTCNGQLFNTNRACPGFFIFYGTR